MSLLVAWIVFPAMLGLLCFGWGLLVERAAGVVLPGALTVSVGLAAIVVVTQACTYWDATAELATPLVLVLGIGGLVVARRALPALRPDLWATAAAAAVFAVFAAPVFLSGGPTFAGYGVLGDTSIHFVLIDRVMEHGRNVSNLAPSSYQAALEGYFKTAYPIGAHMPLGAVRPLVGQDVAWVFQPYLAFLAALTAATLYQLAGSAIASRPVRAAVAFVAAQPALVLAYSLQGSIKEIATVWVLALLVALVPVTVEERAAGLRRLIPPAVATAAGLEVLGLAIAPWLGPLLLAALGALLFLRGRPGLRPTALDAAVFAGLAAVLAVPALGRSKTFVSATKGVVTAPEEVGNLLRPLRNAQMFGIWPSGDYRLLPLSGDFEATYVLIGIVIAAGVFGVVWCVRRRALLPLLFLGISLVGWVYATNRGSPWVDAKALMIVSVPVLFTAMLGAAALFAGGRRVEAVLLAGAIASGMLWSNALAYHDVSLAPRDRLEELRSIGDRFDGKGPILYTEFEEFGKHFLRKGDPTGWTEAWQPGPQRGPFGLYQDIDGIPAAYVLRHPTLVLRRSPSLSRPPALYRRAYRGRFYEVWQRPTAGFERVPAHLPLGGPGQVAARPYCPKVRAVAAKARGPRGRLAYVVRPPNGVAIPASSPVLPRGWSVDGTDPSAVRPLGQGSIRSRIDIPVTGRYVIWLGGSIGREVDVTVDGRTAGSVSYQLSGPGQYVRTGELELRAGPHVVRVSRGGGGLRPGNGGQYSLIGPVIAEPVGAEPTRVEYAASSKWKRLCGRSLDWVEAVRR